MKKMLNIFQESEWPVDMETAEEIAAKKGYDTLLMPQKEGRLMGRGYNGVWCLGIENEFQSLLSIVQYENQYNRSVIMWAKDMNMAEEAYEAVCAADISQIAEFEVPEYLCHSTTMNSFVSIVDDGYIYSYNELKKRKRDIQTIRGYLKEPADYLDYIDLSELSSFSPENVVASREHGKLNVDLDKEYTPGVRIYFKGKDLIELPGVTRIGKRSLKALHKISIDLIEVIIVPITLNKNMVKTLQSKRLLDRIITHKQNIIWTPKKFSINSNELLLKFLKQFK